MPKNKHINKTNPTQLQEGEFLITIDSETPKEMIVYNDTQHHQVKSFIESYAYEIKTFVSPVSKTSYTARGRRYPIKVKSWEGYFISYKDLLVQLQRKKEIVQPWDILRSWGLKYPEDRKEWYQNLHFVNENTVDIVDPPHQTRFEEKFELLANKNGDLPEIKKLYHGTSNIYLPSIIKNGLQLPRHNYGLANGIGIYLGLPDKAKNYAKCGYSYHEKDPINKYKFILEVDAILGRLYEAKTLLYENAPKFVSEKGYDSLYYNGFNRPEWTIYDPSQILIKRVIRVTG